MITICDSNDEELYACQRCGNDTFNETELCDNCTEQDWLDEVYGVEFDPYEAHKSLMNR